MYKLYLKFTFRYFQGHKFHTLISILLLSVGLSSALLIIIWVNDELGTDRFHPELSSLYLVTSKKNPEVEKWNWFGYSSADILKTNYPEIRKAASLESLDEHLLSHDEKTWFRLEGLATQQDFFDMFGFKMLHGDRNKALVNTNSIVLTRKTSEKIFDTENSVGKTIKIKGYDDLLLEVTGILDDVPGNSSIQFTYLVHKDATFWGRMGTEIVLLKEDAELNEVNEKIKYAARESRYANDEESIIHLFPFSDIYFDSDFIHFTHGERKYPKILFFAALIILVIGIVNYISLSTVASLKRSRDTGINKVVGASRINLIMQSLTETSLIIIVAIVITLIITWLSLPGFKAFAGKDLNMDYSRYSLSGIIIITILIIFFFSGLIPAALFSSIKPTLTLKGLFTTGYSIRFFRIGFVILLFACTIFIFIATVILVKQLKYMQTKDLGYDKENIVKVQFINRYSMISDREDYFNDVKLIENELENYPNVICSDNGKFPTELYSMDWKVPGKTSDEQFTINMLVVGYKYAELFDIHMLEGSFFTESETRVIAAGEEELMNDLVINHKAVEFLQLDDPIGTIIENLSWGVFKIIGVTEDFHSENLSLPVKPLMMVCLPYKSNPLLIKMKKGTIMGSMKFIEKLFHQVNPGLPFEFEFFDQHLDMMYRKDQLITKIFSGFAMVSIIMAVIALFSFATYSLDQRLQEIGIRKVFGARVSNILSMLTADYLKYILIAFVIACPLAYYFMQRWLNNFAYCIDLSWQVFLISGILSLFVALLTIARQCYKAATRNPIETLRYE